MGITKNRAKLLYEVQPTVENSGELALEQEVIGFDQTWQDLTGSRSANTIYTNSTGSPIQIYVLFSGAPSSVNNAIEVSEDGVSGWVSVGFRSATGGWQTSRLYLMDGATGR